MLDKELWEKVPPIQIQEVMPIRKRYMTKGRLQKLIRQKGGSMSPVIDTEVRDGADDITEGVAYEIINVEDIMTDVQNLAGIRVTVLSVKAEEGNVVLWKRPVTGRGSKLGVFLTELGNNSDKWLHKWVIFQVWQARNRVLEVIPAPVPKAKKKSAPKDSK